MKSVFLLLCITVLSVAQENKKLGLAVDDLDVRGISKNDAAIISERLRMSLGNLGVFRVMERGQMEAVLKEQGFQQSGACSSDGCQVEMGQLLGVERLIVGQVGRIGEMYTISGKMIDVATGEILFSANEDFEGRIEDLLKEVVPKLAKSLSGMAPKNSSDKKGQSIDPGISAEKKSSDKLSWQTWTQIGLYSVAGLALVGGWVKNREAKDRLADYENLPATGTPQASYDTAWKQVDEREFERNVLLTFGMLALAGGITVTVAF